MKKIGILLLVCAFAVSCSKDMDPGETILYTELAEVTYVGSDGYFEMIRDNGPLLRAVVNERIDYALREGQRVYCSYSILGRAGESGYGLYGRDDVYNIHLIDFYSLVSKPVLRQSDLLENSELDEQVGHDGIFAADQWMAGKWLNIEFNYIRYYTEVVHEINLVWDDIGIIDPQPTANTTGDDVRKVYFIIRHNAMGEDPTASVPTKMDSGMASFDVADIIGYQDESVMVYLAGSNYDPSTGELVEFVKEVGVYYPSKATLGHIVRSEENKYYIGPPVNTTTFVR